MVEQANCISCHKASQRISSDAEFLDVVTVLLQFLEPCFNLVCNALAAKLDAIVGEATGITLGYKDVEVRVSLSNAGSKELEVVGVAPKTEQSQCKAPFQRKWEARGAS